MSDYIAAAQSIADTLERVGYPLSESQSMCLSGAVSVWLKKAYDNGVKDGLDEIIGVMRELREGME